MPPSNAQEEKDALYTLLGIGNYVSIPCRGPRRCLGSSSAYSHALIQRHCSSQKLPWEPELLPSNSQEAGPLRSSTPPLFQGHMRCDSKGNSYTVMPQPVLQPRMFKPE